MCKLKANKAKESAKVESVNTSNPYLLSLSGSFDFDLFFLILPNVIFDNTPVLFL